MPQEKNNIFFFNNFWRILTNVWTVFFILTAFLDFFSNGKYEYLITSFAIIYGAVLSIFVGTKEFARWYNVYNSKRHPGEWAAIMWSIVIVLLGVLSWVYEGQYHISSATISVYIMVLTVFAVTQSSKRIYSKKRRND